MTRLSDSPLYVMRLFFLFFCFIGISACSNRSLVVAQYTPNLVPAVTAHAEQENRIRRAYHAEYIDIPFPSRFTKTTIAQ